MANLELTLQPSKQFNALMLAALLVSNGILWQLPFAWWELIVACVLVNVYIGRILWLDVWLQSSNAVICLQHSVEGNWLLQTRTAHYAVALQGDSTVTRQLVILRFRNNHYRRSVVIFRDSLDDVVYRRLLVVLSSAAA